MRLKLNFATLESLFLNNYAQLLNGEVALLEDSSWWETESDNLQKKDLLFTLESNSNTLYKATIYRRMIGNKWYMHSVLGNNVNECKIVSYDYDKSLTDMVINDENLFVFENNR